MKRNDNNNLKKNLFFSFSVSFETVEQICFFFFCSAHERNELKKRVINPMDKYGMQTYTSR